VLAPRGRNKAPAPGPATARAARRRGGGSGSARAWHGQAVACSTAPGPALPVPRPRVQRGSKPRSPRAPVPRSTRIGRRNATSEAATTTLTTLIARTPRARSARRTPFRSCVCFHVEGQEARASACVSSFYFALSIGPLTASALSFHFLHHRGPLKHRVPLDSLCDTSPAARRPNEVSPPLSPLPPPSGARGRNEVPFARRR
jgi:hypothetical protein